MALEIFRLVGSVFVDTDKANESLSKTDKNAESLGTKLAKGAGTAAKWGAGLVAAATAVGGAMIATAKSTASSADEVDKASQRMGIDAESYQRLAYAADLSGVSTSQLEAASKKLKGTMGDDADLTAYIKDLADMDDITARNEKAAELFGASVAQDLIPMLNAGADGLQGMMEEADALGVVMSNDAVAAGAEMNDTFTKVGDVVKSLTNSVGVALIPMINDLLNWVLAHMPEIRETVGEVVNFISNLIQELIPVIEGMAPIVSALFDIIGNLWTDYLKPILSGIITFLQGVFAGDWAKVWQGLSDVVSKIFQGLVEIVKMPINGIISLLNGAIDGFNKIQIPDWVPLVGGKGLNIPHIPMLAEGGDIIKEGRVLVGEAGPEMLDLPVGARVTPLSKAVPEIDYDRLGEAVAAAMLKILPQMPQVVRVEAEPEGIFKLVRQQGLDYESRTGRPAYSY